MALKSFKTLLADAKQRDGFWVEKAKLDFSIALNRLFEKSGMSQKELSEKLNTSPAYITKVFRGDANFTIETMTKFARAVDGQLHITITEPESSILCNRTNEQPATTLLHDGESYKTLIIKPMHQHSNASPFQSSYN